ncbi:MAG: hypothetical protein OEU94_10225 [Aquincola sp.]|nr:hypothetical protein [Aquincola sp.]MDH4287651.1 hypothetical protein [Aquincola sp.]MDH5331699.1 hypothetical protein [Aquincola sp.]
MARVQSPTLLSTRWEGEDLLVLDGDRVIDRLAAREIHRVILVCDRSDSPSDLVLAIFETATDHLVFPPQSGIAGRVHFERQGFWMQRPCIYWTSASRARLPRQLMAGVWPLRRHKTGYLRLPIGELAATLERWPLEGPQTWEQRKWARIAANRVLPPAGRIPQ